MKVVAVASGKGGVGKSTISLNLALALARDGADVGLLDADFYGPDIPLMVNLKRSEPLTKWMLGRNPKAGALKLEPVERYGIKIMSVGFLLAEKQALTWGSPMGGAALRQLLVDVEWGELDYLIVDLPPGTADLQQQLLDLVTLAGAIVVVGPQDVAHLDAQRVVSMLRAANVRILGGIENMSHFVCPHCGEPVDVFPRVREERSIWANGVERLATIPLEPSLAAAGDHGRPDPPPVFEELARRVASALSDSEGTLSA